MEPPLAKGPTIPEAPAKAKQRSVCESIIRSAQKFLNRRRASSISKPPSSGGLFRHYRELHVENHLRAASPISKVIACRACLPFFSKHRRTTATTDQWLQHHRRSVGTPVG